jgi:DNA modification methylase
MVYCFSLGPKYYYDYLGIEEPSKNAGRVVKYNGKQKNTGLVEKAPGSVARNITIRATRRKRSVWSVSPQASKSMHTATFPIDLITPMIVAGCPIGGTVLDPFGGMGTTGLVAQSLKRKAILIELNPSYAKLSLERIQADRK